MLGRADIGDLVERIDRARADRSRACRDAERAIARGTVGGDGGAERADFHAVSLVGRDLSDRLGAEPEELGRFLDAAVAVRSHVKAKCRVDALKPFGPYVPAALERGLVASGRERHEGRHRAPAHQEPHAALGGELDQLHEPAHRGALDVDCRMVTAGAARVQGSRQEIGDHPDGRRRRVHPAEEPRMTVAHRVRQDGGAEAFQHDLGTDAGSGERLLHERGPFGRSHRREDRCCGDPGEIVGDEIDGLVCEMTEVLGVETRRRGRVGARGHRVFLLPRGRARRGRSGVRWWPSSIAR